MSYYNETDSNRNSYRREYEPEEEIEPILEGYQLIGDSQFLRFSEQLLNKNRRNKNGLSFIGLCVSGQKANDLLGRIRSKFHSTSDKAVLMIGTNDLLKNTPITTMRNCINQLVLELIRGGVHKLIVLTIPPVPRLKTSRDHWNSVKDYNDHIKNLHNGSDIFVIDAYPYFIKDDSSQFLSLSRSSTLSSSRDSLGSNAPLVSNPLLRANSLDFPCPPSLISNTERIKTNLRIQIGKAQRTVYVMDSDSDDENEGRDSSYSSLNTTPTGKRNGTFLTPNPKRRSYGSVFSPADDDHNDRICYNDSLNEGEFDQINEDYFEEFFGSNTQREDKIHLNNKGLRLLQKLILDKITA